MAMRCLVLFKLLVTLLFASVASGAPLFTEDAILDVTLVGPIRRMVRSKTDRDEYPFNLMLNGETVEIKVRLRGHSRVRLCEFPPLRLNFPNRGTVGTVFEGFDKIKMVTHCRRNSSRAEDNMLDEYAAYRLFNLLSDKSYRVQLLRVSYVDSEGKMKGIERPYYAYLIEPEEVLAERLEGKVLRAAGVLYSKLEPHQTALMNVFQYLIGNADWSFVRAEGEEFCCHNVDLIDTGGGWVPVPYDFDLAGLVDAVYGGSVRTNQTARRQYGGYCKSPIESVAEALDEIVAREQELMTFITQVPALADDTRQHRVQYLQEFFAAAAARDSLLEKFERSCLGRT
jgi:hypothetical protein